MAAVKKTTGKQEPVTRSGLISLYMNYVLEKGESPGTVYKFSKENNIEEAEFYTFFGSFENLKMAVWEQFFDHSVGLMEKSSEYAAFSTKEKLLTFYYTFFEVLTANRSYVLFSLKQEKMPLKNLEQLKGLRRNIKDFAKNLMKDSEEKQPRLIRQTEMVFAEGAWLEFLFLLNFWMNDNSSRFESTDVAIEKSVNTAYELFNTKPLERVLDLGKFIWKERMV